MVATGVAEDIAQAQKNACGLADRIIAPNVRYRRDIGNELMARDYARPPQRPAARSAARGARLATT